MTTSKKTLRLVQYAFLIAIEAIVCFTPLGALPALGPIVATLSHVPVIIAAIVLGLRGGIVLGGTFGLFSFIVFSFVTPGPFSFLFTPLYSFGDIHGNFWSLVICFVPRILIGVVTALAYKGFSKWMKGNMFAYGIAGVLGSLTNTILVLGGSFLFFGQAYAQAAGIAYNLVFGVIALQVLTSGLPEAVIGGIAGMFVARPVQRALGRIK